MHYADIKENDIVNGESICVSFWCQGCHQHFHCKGCHNPQTWDFNGGLESTEENIINNIIYLLNKNNIKRNLSLLGGEPLCFENINFINNLIEEVKKIYKDIKIFVWTGYEIENLQQRIKNGDKHLENILNNTYILICGPYIEEKRDITLKWRGSSNQRVIDVQKSLKDNKIVLHCD